MRNYLMFIMLAMFMNYSFAGMQKCKDDSGKVTYSDKACAAGSTSEKNTASSQADSNTQNVQSPGSSGGYTKDREALQSSDAATMACFQHVNTTAHYPDPSTTKMLSSTKKWVTVKSVGARQMVVLGLTSKNEAGMYVGTQSYNCLMMGDGVTVSPYPYELL